MKFQPLKSDNPTVPTFKQLMPGDVYKAANGRILMKIGFTTTSPTYYCIDPVTGVGFYSTINDEYFVVAEVFPEASFTLQAITLRDQQ